MARSACYENLFVVETLEDGLEEISLKAVIQVRAVRASLRQEHGRKRQYKCN